MDARRVLFHACALLRVGVGEVNRRVTSHLGVLVDNRVGQDDRIQILILISTGLTHRLFFTGHHEIKPQSVVMSIK